MHFFDFVGVNGSALVLETDGHLVNQASLCSETYWRYFSNHSKIKCKRFTRSLG
jgi:hypothetical protein